MLVQRAIPSVNTVSGAAAIALDFETASQTPGSICSVGLAWIADGQVAHTAHCLVRPHDMRFDPWHVSIHGIQPHDVEFEPEFPSVWEELLPHLEATPLLLAHNAPFDIGVLRAALSHYDLAWPTLSYLCTVKIARVAWPDLPNHKLPTVAEHIGFELQHHAADSDAAACAGIALRVMQDAGSADLMALLPRFGIKPGKLEPGYHEACSSAAERRSAFRRHRPPPWMR